MNVKSKHVKTNKTYFKLGLMVLILTLFMTSCSFTEKIITSTDSGAQAWKLITDSAKRTEVSLCVDANDEKLADWLEGDFAEMVKTEYNVTVKVTRQTMAKTFEKLAEEARLEVTNSMYDVIFLEGDNFQKAMANDYLYGPFTDQVPSFTSYLNKQDLEMRFDEGQTINGYEVPFARTQLYMIYDENYFYELPESNEDLIELMRSFKGQFTYPDPRSSKEGQAFIVSLMLPYLDVEKLNSGEYDKATLEAEVKPVLNQLKQLKSSQYQNGQSFPESIEALDALYRNGDVIFSMSLANNYATDQLRAYEYPEETNVFVIPGGSTGYTDYVGIAKNATNKSAALVVINALLSPDGQAGIYEPKNIGKLPVYDLTQTPADAFSALKSVKLKATTLDYTELLGMRFSEIDPSMRAIMVDLWTTYVLNDATGE